MSQTFFSIQKTRRVRERRKECSSARKFYEGEKEGEREGGGGGEGGGGMCACFKRRRRKMISTRLTVVVVFFFVVSASRKLRVESKRTKKEMGA